MHFKTYSGYHNLSKSCSPLLLILSMRPLLFCRIHWWIQDPFSLSQKNTIAIRNIDKSYNNLYMGVKFYCANKKNLFYEKVLIHSFINYWKVSIPPSTSLPRNSSDLPRSTCNIIPCFTNCILKQSTLLEFKPKNHIQLWYF